VPEPAGLAERSQAALSGQPVLPPPAPDGDRSQPAGVAASKGAAALAVAGEPVSPSERLDLPVRPEPAPPESVAKDGSVTSAPSSDPVSAGGAPDLPPVPDSALVARALAGAAARAAVCAEPGGSGGAASVRVLLNPAGGVLRATVTDAPFAGTGVGACLERLFQAATTPAFAGRTLSTGYTVSVPAL
jgi:hypothetical protein